MSEIQRHFDTTYSKASWVLSAYAVAFSGFIAVSGRIGDIIGHANLYIWSSALFALFSLLCGAVDSLTALIVFRTLQGVAAAALVPSGYAIVARSFPPEKLGSRFSILAAGFSLSFGVGYIVGGAFDLTSVGYKGIYYVSGGVMFVDAALGFFFIKDIPPTGEKVVNLDAVGSFLLIGATTLVVVGFTEAGEVWNSPKTSAHAQVAADDAGTGVCSSGCLHELLHAVCNHLAVGGVFPVRGAKLADISRSQAGPKPDRHVRRDDIIVPEKRYSAAIHLVHAGLLGDRGRGSIMCDVE
ncbi:hypothetical protein KL907_004144 [Ogataea polymorpha]|nr:hypothetical protein KL907_004144 [Ogataea polymorpha]